MGGSFGKKNRLDNQTKEQLKTSQNIDQDNLQDHVVDKKVIKLLLLGAGESGKSTLFKQMIQLYGEGFAEASMKSYAEIISKNLIISMKTLVQWSDIIDGCSVPELEDEKALVAKANEGLKITPELAKAIEALWNHPKIKETFSFRSKFQIPDSAGYFFQNIMRVAEDDYVPIYEDVLRCRARTTGIIETRFNVQGNRFQMIDVGGQRSERKKWVHCFQDVTAVIFVAAINEYDQVLYEDGVTNRVAEALDLFGRTCNSKWFTKASMILFLNKSDLFKEKVPKVDMSCCFPEYTGRGDVDAATEYMKNQFLNRNTNKNMEVYAHVTCATSTDNVDFTFNAVKDILLANSLKVSGLY